LSFRETFLAADIELTLAIGVHGPEKLDIIVA
jgi:L-lactate utilization protein LutC